jgi:PAS domain S-box-containing protein
MSLASDAREVFQPAIWGEAFEHAPVALLLKTEQGRYAAVNQAACELTGYTREELMSLPPEELSGRDPDQLRQNLAEFARTGTLPGRTPLRRKDGAVIDVDYRWIDTKVGGLPFLIFFMVPAGSGFFADR